MSDPVTNLEIEDVLSSIRRLVSSDGRPLKAHDPVADNPKRAEPERLVLTPSLRVDDAVERQVDDPQDHDVAPDATQDAASDASGHDDDWSNEVDAPDAESEEMQGSPADEFDADLAMADVDDETGTAAEDSETGPTFRSDRLRERVAELEEVVSRQHDQWEPDGPGGDGNSGSPVSPLPWEDHAPDEDWSAELAEEPEAKNAAEPEAEQAEEAIEDAIAKAARQSEPSAPQAEPEADDDDIPQNFAASEAAEQTADHRVRSRIADPDDLAENDFLPGNDEFLDEDALRDLVADIVRQELQGALGERITRNVRKLVRREIHRALTSQELQ